MFVFNRLDAFQPSPQATTCNLLETKSAELKQTVSGLTMATHLKQDDSIDTSQLHDLQSKFSLSEIPS